MLFFLLLFLKFLLLHDIWIVIEGLVELKLLHLLPILDFLILRDTVLIQFLAEKVVVCELLLLRRLTSTKFTRRDQIVIVISSLSVLLAAWCGSLLLLTCLISSWSLQGRALDEWFHLREAFATSSVSCLCHSLV